MITQHRLSMSDNTIDIGQADGQTGSTKRSIQVVVEFQQAVLNDQLEA